MRLRLGLQPIEPPDGTPPEAAEHFRKLDPVTQRYAVAAREHQGLEPPGTLAMLEAAARIRTPMLVSGDDG